MFTARTCDEDRLPSPPRDTPVMGQVCTGTTGSIKALSAAFVFFAYDGELHGLTCYGWYWYRKHVYCVCVCRVHV